MFLGWGPPATHPRVQVRRSNNGLGPAVAPISASRQNGHFPSRRRPVRRPARGDPMKIVVIGGTGLIGSKVVQKLAAKGHEVVAAAPNTGVNTLTGEGLAEALRNAQV